MSGPVAPDAAPAPAVERGRVSIPLAVSARQLVMPLVAVAVTAALLMHAAGLSRYSLQLVTVALLYGIVAISLDLAWGYTGILSMGHAVFFGLGAYGVGIMSVDVSASTGAVLAVERQWWTFPSGGLVGVGAAMLTAMAVGAFAFWGKATPFYIAVVTLALTVVMVTVFEQTQQLGGQGGLQGFAIRTIAASTWYWISAASLFVVTGFAFVFVRSDCGLLLKSIRDNEDRVRYLGFNVPLVKLAVFTISAGVAAFAGVLYAGFIGFVSPPFLGFLVATEILIWVAVGGRGTLLGPIVGAVAISLVGPRLSAEYPFQWTLILGLLFIAVVTFIPDGLLPGLLRLGRSTGVRLRLLPPGGTERALRRDVRAAPERAERRPGSNGAAEPVLVIDDLHRAFGALEVLKGISMTARRGELLAILGPNGAGKSTLLGALADGTVGYRGNVNLHTTGGHIELGGLPPRRIVAAGIGRGFQTPNLFETLTPSESVLLASHRGAIPSVWRRSKIVDVPREAHAIIAATGLLDVAASPVADLSHGQKKALELAVTVALEPEVLLLDEPTAGLTAEERKLIGTLLRHIVEDQGITVVLIEHDFEFVRLIADRIAVLHDGIVRLLGTVDEVANDELLKEIYLGVGA